MRPMFHSRIKIIVFGIVWLSLFGTALKITPQSNQRTRRLRSYSGPNGHVMVIVPGGEFTMGSALAERGRSQDEIPHRVRIPRTYAIATTEVTNEQFARFLAAVPDYGARWRAATATRFGNPARFLTYSRTSDS